MSDLINRADAIRVISEEYHNRDGNFDGLDAIRELETLPSKGGDAEILNEDFRPKYMQQCPDNGADLISRADAIEAVNMLDIFPPTKDAVARELMALPSADALLKQEIDFHKEVSRIEAEKVVDLEHKLADAEQKSDAYKRGFEDCKRAYEIELARSADAVQGWRIGKPTEQGCYMVTLDSFGHKHIDLFYYGKPMMPNRKVRGKCWYRSDDEWGDVVYDDKEILAWQPLPKPYKGGDPE